MKKETKAWVFLILLSLIWGSSFILMEKAMFPKPNKPAFTALQVGALRTLIASLVLLPIALIYL
jgi:drug/metabolite transporter (DMT)-like permease